MDSMNPNLSSLPEDLLVLIMACIPTAQDLNRLRRCCRHLRLILDSNPALYHYKTPTRLRAAPPFMSTKTNEVADLLIASNGIIVARNAGGLLERAFATSRLEIWSQYDFWAQMSDRVESAKRAAAYRAVDEHVKNGMIVGIGSGSTVVYAAERLAQRVEIEALSIVCVPTSFQAKQLILQHNLILADLETRPNIDVTIDGADEIDPQLNCIKGGGGCLTQEKIVASASRQLVLIADARKRSPMLGEVWTKGVPIEVIPFAWKVVSSKLESLGGQPKLRMAVAKAGPVVTDNGGFILDVVFGHIQDPAALEHKLRQIVGIVETGLFVHMATIAYLGEEDGSVSVLTK